MKKWVVIAAWLIAAAIAFPFQSKLQVLASDESDAFKHNGAESSQVDEIIEQRFEEGDETTAVVVYTRQDQQRMLEDGQKFCEKRRIPDVVRVITAFQGICGELPKITLPQSSMIKPLSEDGSTALSTVWTSDDATESVVRDVAAMREVRPDWAYVTGEAGFAADQAAALEGIDETLLIATLILVLVLLLLIYRSPVIALVPLLVVGIAYVVAAGVVYAGAQAGLYQATGQATAILIVLMFGAGTDYCLLLLARYREELANDTPDAMGTALRRTAPAIVSAGGIVVVMMLVLTVADYNATRWMGPVLAIGTAITVLAGVTLLPAVLAVLPQRAFTHKKPIGPIWPRIGALVRRRPAMLATAVVAVLVAGALGNLKEQGTLDFSEQFRETPESVEGLHILQAKFPPGQPGPVDLLVPRRSPPATTSRRSGWTSRRASTSSASSRTTSSRSSTSRCAGPVEPSSRQRHPAPAREREEVQPTGHGRRPDRGGAGLRDRALPRRAPHHPARARARVPDRRRAAAQPGRADLRGRDGDPVLRLRARRLRLHLPRDGPGDAAVHVHLPGRAGRRLQRLPAHPDQGGEARSPPRGRGHPSASNAPAA